MNPFSPGLFVIVIGRFLIAGSILLVIGLFIFLFLYESVLVGCYSYRNLFISLKLFSLLVYNCS